MVFGARFFEDLVDHATLLDVAFYRRNKGIQRPAEEALDIVRDSHVVGPILTIPLPSGRMYATNVITLLLPISLIVNA